MQIFAARAWRNLIFALLLGVALVPFAPDTGAVVAETQFSHLGDAPLPEGVFDEAEAAIVRYAQRSTRSITIDNATYADLARHFTVRQIMDICLTVGVSNMVNRFHATFLTDLDQETIAALEPGDAAAPARFP